MLLLSAIIEVEGKPEPKPYKSNDGENRYSYKLNVSQDEGRNTATISCDQKIYDSVKRHDVLSAVFAQTDYNGKMGLKLMDIRQVSQEPKTNIPNGEPKK